jgi:hypothetical protein
MPHWPTVRVLVWRPLGWLLPRQEGATRVLISVHRNQGIFNGRGRALDVKTSR